MTSDELKQAREALRMTQGQLANELGIDLMTVSRWEREITVIPSYLPLALKALKPLPVKKGRGRPRLIETTTKRKKVA